MGRGGERGHKRAVLALEDTRHPKASLARKGPILGLPSCCLKGTCEEGGKAWPSPGPSWILSTKHTQGLEEKGSGRGRLYPEDCHYTPHMTSGTSEDRERPEAGLRGTPTNWSSSS